METAKSTHGVTCSEGSSGYALVDNTHFQWLVQEQSKRAAKSNMPSKDAAEAINCLKDILKRLPDGLNDDENEFVDDICEWWDHRKKAVRRGWRAFKCGRRPCQFVWAEPTAGHDWLDVVRCPNCMTTPCEPVRSWPDSELKVDEHGNLVNGGL